MTAGAPLHAEVALAAGYAIFLFLTALALEWFGRHSHRRSGQFRTAGFTYHPQLDAWQCPEGHHLRRLQDHPERRRARYRAPAHICNGCPYKANCTDSDEGREIETSALSWIETESGRFHRGMSLVVLVLAGLILVVEMIRYPRGTDMAVLGINLVAVTVAGIRRVRWRMPRGPIDHRALNIDHRRPRY